MCTATYTLKNGTNVSIEYDDTLSIAIAYDNQNKEIGSFIFKEIEYEYGHETYTNLRITNMNLLVTGQRLGESIIQHVKDVTGCQIEAGNSNGIKEDDGSNLTGGGVGFIARMREKGLVLKDTIDDEYE